MILPHNTIVMLADGAHLLVLCNEGDAEAPELHVIAQRYNKVPTNRDLVTDAPGTSFSSSSPRRSTHDQGDPHSTKEKRFLVDAADTLADLVAKLAGGIIVAAPPPALGILRQAYSEETKARLIAEFDKDLKALPLEDVTRWLLAH